MARKPAETVKVQVRIREKLRLALDAEAKKTGISLNREIERRLERSLTNQTFTEVIKLAADATAKAYSRDISDRLNIVFALLGKPDLMTTMKGNQDD